MHVGYDTHLMIPHHSSQCIIKRIESKKVCDKETLANNDDDSSNTRFRVLRGCLSLSICVVVFQGHITRCVVSKKMSPVSAIEEMGNCST